MADGKSVNLQLNINTAFKNIDQAINSFKSKLSTIKLNDSLTKNLSQNFEAQANQIRDTLNKVANFNFDAGSTKEYSSLLNQLSTQYSQLASMAKQFGDINITQLERSIDKQKQDIASIKDQISQRQQQIIALSQGRQEYEKLTAGATSLSDKEKQLANTYKNNIPTIQQLTQEITSLQRSQGGHQTQLNRSEAALSAYNVALTQQKNTVKLVKNEIDTVVNARKDDVDAAKQQEQVAKQLNASFATQANALDQVGDAYLEQKQLMDSTADGFLSAMNGSDSLSSSIEQQILKWGSLNAIVDVAQRSIQDIIQTYQELDDNLAAISSVSGISTQELWGDMPSMIDNADRLALSVEDLTNGMLLFYQQGLDTAEMEIRLDAAGKMATISQQSLSTAVDQLTSTMNAFSMAGDDAQRVVDTYAALAGATATDVEELATAMARTASIAQSAGLSFEETTAFLTTMEETTRLSSETIGMSFRSIVARFQQLKKGVDELDDGVSANQVEKALASVDVALRDATGQFRPLGDVLMELSAKWDTLDTNTQRYIATIAAGTQQQSNFLALIGNYEMNVDNLNTAMNSAGAAEEQFAAFSTSLSAALQRLDNAVVAVQTSWLDSASAISGAVDVLSLLLNAISLIPAPLQALIAAFTVLTAKTLAHQIATQKMAAAQALAATVTQQITDASTRQAVVDELNTALKKKLTQEELAQVLAQTTLNKAQQEAILASYAEATANKALSVSFTSIGAAAKGAATAVAAFAAAHPIITAIAAVIGIAVTAFTAFQNQAKKAQEKIDELTQSVSELNSAADESQSIANSLDGYIDSLKQARQAGEDLTSIRQQIQESGYLEGTGVDALTAQYNDLVEALKEAREEREKEAKVARGNAISEQARLTKEEASNTFKNTKPLHPEIFSASGERLTAQQEKDLEHTRLEQRFETSEEAAEYLGFKVQYYLDVDGKIQTFDSKAEFDAAYAEIENNVNNTKRNLSHSEADDVLASLEETNQNFVQEIGSSRDQTIAMIQAYAAAVGTEFKTEEGLLKPEVREFFEGIGQEMLTGIEQQSFSTEQFISAMQGNFSGMTNETVAAIQNYANSLSSSNEGIDDSIRETFAGIEQTYDTAKQELADTLSKDYQLIDEDTAESLSLDSLNVIKEAYEATGPEIAKNIADLLANDFKDVFDSEQLLDLEEIFAGLDVNDSDSIEGALESFELLREEVGLTQEQFEPFLEVFGQYIATVAQLNGITLETTSQYDFLNQALGDGYNTFEEFASAAEQAGLDVSQLGVYIDDATGAWKASESALNGYIAALQTANRAEANAILAKATLENSSLNNAIALDQETIATQGLSNATITDAMVSLQAQKNKINAQIEAAQAVINAISAEQAARAAGVNAQAEAYGTMNSNSEKVANTTNSLGRIIENFYSLIGKVNPYKDETIKTEAMDEISDDALTKIKSEAEQYIADAQSHIGEIDNAIGILSAYQQSVAAAQKAVEGYGNASGGGGGGGGGGGRGGGATDQVNQLTEAIKAQKEALQQQIDVLDEEKQALEDQKQALQDQKDTLEELNDELKENLELYLDLINTKLEDEIERQTQSVEAFYDAIRDSIDNEIDALQEKLDSLEKEADRLEERADKLQEQAEEQEDQLNKLYDAAMEYYDAMQEGIDNEIALQDEAIARNEDKIALLESQKDALDDQIDALNQAADSESKLLALEKARDALENARNSKTRLVLTNGGGWRFRTDQSAVQSAQEDLASAERDYQELQLERQQDALDKQIEELEVQNDQLEDVKDTLEAQKDSIDSIKDDWESAADALGMTTSELQEQTALLQQIAMMSPAGQNDLLSNFQGSVSNNNQQFQTAADAANQADQASNAFDQQNNADVSGSIASAIEALKQQQNLADEAQKIYFENLLSNNAQEVLIQQEMQQLIASLVGQSQGQYDQFAIYQEAINGALEMANQSAQEQAEYINRINEAIEFYNQWSNNLDLTTEEILNRQGIENEVNNATLASLLEGGTTFSQLQNQYNEIIRNNDEAVRIQGQIDAVDVEIEQVQTQIDELKAQQDLLSEQEKQISNANANKVSKAVGGAGSSISRGVKDAQDGITEGVNKSAGDIKDGVDGVSNQFIDYTQPMLIKTESMVNSLKTLATDGISIDLPGSWNTMFSKAQGGPVGFSKGGVDDFTSLVQVHGTKNRPELVLNNSQSAALFKYIDSMTRIPTFSTASSARNALQSINNTTNENGTTFTNCEFNIESSNASNLDSLVLELKQSASIRRS